MMDGNLHIIGSKSNVFLKFRNVCIPVIKYPSIETLKLLQETIEEYVISENPNNNGCDQQILNLTPFLDYISLPLLVILKNPNERWSVLEQAAQCLTQLLKTVHCTSVQSFLAMFSACFMAVADRQNPSNVSDCSEELKQFVLGAVRQLVHCCTAEVLMQLTQHRQYKVQLGHAIFLCLKMAQEETSRTLRVDALNCICVLGMESALHVPSCPESNRVLTTSCRKMFSDFLPGICSVAAKLALGDEKQGHKLIKCAVHTLGYFVRLVLENDFVACYGDASAAASPASSNSTLQQLQQVLGGQQQQQLTKQQEEEERPKDDTFTLTSGWLSRTSQHVCLLVESVLNHLQTHPHPAVRGQVVEVVRALLVECQKSLPGIVLPCVETLAALAADTDNTVRERAVHAINNNNFNKSSVNIANNNHSDGIENNSNDDTYIEIPETNSLCCCNDDGRSIRHTSNTTSCSDSSSSMNTTTGNNSSDSCSIMNTSNTTSIGSSTSSDSNSSNSIHYTPALLTGEVQASLQERLCEAVRRLPTVARGADCRRVLHVLRRLRGCLLLLPPAVSVSLMSLPAQLSRLLLSVASALSYDTSDPHLLQCNNMPIDPLSESSSVLPSELGERRLYIKQSYIIHECVLLCHWLGASINSAHTVHEWAELLRAHTYLAPELLFLLPHILKGYTNVIDSDCPSSLVKKMTQDELESFVHNLLNILLTDKLLLASIDSVDASCSSPETTDLNMTSISDSAESCNTSVTSGATKPNQNIVTSLDNIYHRFQSPFNPCLQPSSGGSSNSNDSSSSLQQKRHVLVVSKSLHVVAATAALMGARFVVFWGRVMCPLMEKCGERNLLVSHTARLVLHSVGRSCGCRGLRGLVEDSVPNFWFPLSMQLKRPQQHPKAPQILQVALQCSSERLSSFLQQLLHELLLCLDSHRSLAPQQLLVLLRLYLAGHTRQPRKREPQRPACQTEQGSEEKQSCETDPEVAQERLDPNSKGEKLDGIRIPNEVSSGGQRGDVEETVTNNLPSSSDIRTKTFALSEVNREDKINLNNKPSIGPLAIFLLNYHEKHEKEKVALQEEQIEALKIVDLDLEELKKESDSSGFNKECNSSGLDKDSDKNSNSTVIDTDSNPGVRGFEQHVKDKSTKDPYDEESMNKNIKRDDDGPEEVPEDVQLLVSILERCCYLLHTRDRDAALVLLDTIELGCLALQDWENSQLPVLHKVWKPLMLRIRDTDTIVTLRALAVCCVMVTSCGDFLRKRCLQELLPIVNKFLTSQMIVSINKTAKCGYLLSAAYVTQRRLLETLYPDLIVGLKLGPSDMTEAVRCCVGYLDSRQPVELVVASLAVLRRVAVDNLTHVLLALAHIMGPMLLEPPSPHLLTVQVKGVSRSPRQLPGDARQLFDTLVRRTSGSSLLTSRIS